MRVEGRGQKEKGGIFASDPWRKIKSKEASPPPFFAAEYEMGRIKSGRSGEGGWKGTFSSLHSNLLSATFLLPPFLLLLLVRLARGGRQRGGGEGKSSKRSRVIPQAMSGGKEEKGNPTV